MDPQERKLGPYTLVNKIGRGAFGVVWMAEKRSAIATTRFALKLPRDEDIDLNAFKQEATIWLQASGHPNVVPMIEADIYDGQVVIVSEYVTDGSLAAWIGQHGGRAPSIEAASELIDGVLAGLAHLHGRHIIHRDLKPDNILLQNGTPRLADFGIARLLKSGSYSTNISGTLAYMAPEAFDGKRTEQTDVWSAGVIFYQLLAGRLPYDQTDTAAFVGAIMRNDPPSLPDSVPQVLQHIVIRALRREPTERYATAKEMRKDLREAEHKLWQGQQDPPPFIPATPPVDRIPQPTIPNPEPAVTERLDSGTRPMPFVPFVPAVRPETKSGKSYAPFYVAGAFGVLVLGIIFAVGIYFIATRNTKKESVSSTPLPTKVKQAQSTYSLRQSLSGHTNYGRGVAFTRDGKTLASSSDDSSIKIWDATSGTLRQTITNGSAVNSIAFSPDGRVLASGDDRNNLKLWDVQSGALKQTMSGHTLLIWFVAFSPDGDIVASCSKDNTVKLWYTQTGGLKTTLSGHTNFVNALAFSPDGKTLASGSDDKSIILWDTTSGTKKQSLTGHTDSVQGLSFSSNGYWLASGSKDASIRLWDAQTGEMKQNLSGHSGFVWSVDFSADGTLLASSGQDKMVKIWDPRSGALKQTLTGHTDQVWSVAFSPDGKTLASNSWDKAVKIWTGE